MTQITLMGLICAHQMLSVSMLFVLIDKERRINPDADDADNSDGVNLRPSDVICVDVVCFDWKGLSDKDRSVAGG